jgi:hypothetical protein
MQFTNLTAHNEPAHDATPEQIEAAHEAQARARPTLSPPREPNGDEVLASMGRMTPEARTALLNKLRQ